MLDVIIDTLIDGLKLLPFLFLAYVFIELLEHKAGAKTHALINRSGKYGPLIGASFGIVPQCGFSAAMSNLYAGGVITRGTLIAIFLSTSDEMLPILISESAPLPLILKILAVKLIAGTIVGFFVDAVFREKTGMHIHDMCHDDDCHCEEGSILKSALIHTARIFAFILVISFLLNTVVYILGEERLAAFILNKPVIGELLSGMIGLIPNCASSVVITQLFMQGGMSTGALLSGLLVGSGVGLLILFRVNHNTKDNVKTLVILYISGVLVGTLAGLLPIF